MKTFIILFVLSFFTSCTHYSTEHLTKDKVIVSKTTNVLGFYGGDIYTCRKDDKGIIIDCKINEIKMREE